jgi:hypothetical protein
VRLDCGEFWMVGLFIWCWFCVRSCGEGACGAAVEDSVEGNHLHQRYTLPKCAVHTTERNKFDMLKMTDCIQILKVPRKQSFEKCDGK